MGGSLFIFSLKNRLLLQLSWEPEPKKFKVLFATSRVSFFLVPENLGGEACSISHLVPFIVDLAPLLLAQSLTVWSIYILICVHEYCSLH